MSKPKPKTRWAWPHFYWKMCEHFGLECYKTWRAELLASVVIVVFTSVITQQWKDFKTALLATGLTLGIFAIWHLLRTPWILHRHMHGDSTAEPGKSAGIFGLIALVGIVVGGFQLGITLWNARPLGDIRPIYAMSDPAKDDEIKRLSSSLRDLQDKYNNKDQMNSLFEGERAKFVFSNVHFASDPYQRTPSGTRIDLPTTAGYEPGVALQVDNSGRMDATDLTIKTALILLEHLDRIGEEALYERVQGAKPVTDRDVLKGERIFLRAALGHKLTSKEQTGLHAEGTGQKYFYVVMIAEYRDKLGTNTSEFCGHYAASDLTVAVPCFKHNR
jgi:hypothetical protein